MRPGEAPVLCIGETMAQVTPQSGTVASADTFLVTAAGAESNVAVGLAQLGHDARWLGRVGDDALGRRILAALTAEGVDVRLVQTDQDRRPTGVFVKDPGAQASVVTYYRAGSAGSMIDADAVEQALAGVRHAHISGVTPALSVAALAATERTLDAAARHGVTTSFDVNHRPTLWPDHDTAAAVLLRLAERATVVFVGRDEAERLWGAATDIACRRLLPGVPHLVVKDGAVEASEHAGAVRTARPANTVTVTDVVGAGDAFASGWLHGYLTGADASDRLRFGHQMAERALTSPGDYASTAIDPERFAIRPESR